MTQYTIFTTDGAVTHLDKRDENSNLLPLELSELEALFPAFNASLLELVAAKDAELTASKTALAELTAYKDAMVERVSGVLASKDPVQYEALAKKFLTPAQELERAKKLEQYEALKAELGI